MKILLGLVIIFSNLSLATPTIELKVTYLCDGEVTSETKMVLNEEDFTVKKIGGVSFPFLTDGKCDPRIPGIEPRYGWSNTLQIYSNTTGIFSAALWSSKWEKPIGGKPSSFFFSRKELNPFPMVGQSASVFDDHYSSSGKVRIETRVEVVKITE